MRTYTVKEAFVTIQGEGVHAGRRAVFVRFSGCNLWSGRAEDRARDSMKGGCAKWCDTDFVGTDGVNGGRYTAEDLAAKVAQLWGDCPRARMLVLTGGEPSLQYDEALRAALQRWGFVVHMETNGTRLLGAPVDWVTLSPKPGATVMLRIANEVKVVYDGTTSTTDPATVDGVRTLHRFVQPLDFGSPEDIVRSRDACIKFVMDNPEWRVGVQLHKILGLA